jgi:hypothetical protein
MARQIDVQKMNHTVHAEIQVEPPFLCEALLHVRVRKRTVVAWLC